MSKSSKQAKKLFKAIDVMRMFRSFWFWSLDFVSNFGFRYSNFRPIETKHFLAPFGGLPQASGYAGGY